MRKLWESNSFIDDNTLTVNVTILRERLEDIIKWYLSLEIGISILT